jgi:hypothetical protein
MIEETRTEVSPPIRAALDELEAMIAARFPSVTFVVQEEDDPPGIYLLATVDIEDTDEVIDIIGDRLVDIQVYEGLPVYVVPLRPIERVLAELEARRASGVPWLQRSA